MRVLADGWYSWEISSWHPLTEIVSGVPERLRLRLLRNRVARGLILAILASRFDAVAVIRADASWRTLLLMRALFGRRRKLVILHFIDHPPRAGGLGRAVDLLWRLIDRWATARAMLSAQVLSASEGELYARRFGIAPQRFVFIPFAWRITAIDQPSPEPTNRHGVVAAGRAHCDWATLFAAAADSSWPLTVVCAEHDQQLVEQLNRDGRATVHVDIPHEQARELLRRAAISAMPMFDGELSHGHVRLCDAVDAGAAVVTSMVKGFDGYIESGRTALVVEPEDAGALRAGVEQLLADKQQRAALASTAYARAAQWTWDHYLGALQDLAAGRTPLVPATK